MPRLTKLLLTLPLLALPLQAAPEVRGEAVMTQMDALRLLAKSRAADGKCRMLAAGEADELNSYLARAEVAAAGRHSVSEIQSTITLGKALGDSSECSAATYSEIGATLAASRDAMASVNMASIKRGRVAAPEEAEPVEPYVAERKPRKADGEPRRQSLAQYGRQAFAYYVERRCEYLSRRDVRKFWAVIVREHKAALAAYGGPAVAGTVRRARQRADEVDCDASGRQLVRSEYTRLAGS